MCTSTHFMRPLQLPTPTHFNLCARCFTHQIQHPHTYIHAHTHSDGARAKRDGIGPHIFDASPFLSEANARLEYLGDAVFLFLSHTLSSSLTHSLPLSHTLFPFSFSLFSSPSSGPPLSSSLFLSSNTQTRALSLSRPFSLSLFLTFLSHFLPLAFSPSPPASLFSYLSLSRALSYIFLHISI